MGEMREAQDAEDQRHADRAERIDRAEDQPGDQDLVDEEDELVHRQRLSMPVSPIIRLRRGSSWRLRGRRSARRPVPVKRFGRSASTKPCEAKASAWRAFCSTIRMPTPALLMAMMLLEDLDHVARRQAGRRLVEQQQPRLAHQRPAHGHHLPLAARELAGRLAALFAQRREHVVDPVDRWRKSSRADEGAHLEVLLDDHRGEDVVLLRHEGEALGHQPVGRQVGDVLAVEADVAFRNGEQAEERLQRRRLAGAVRPDDDADIWALDGDDDAVEDRRAAIAADRWPCISSRLIARSPPRGRRRNRPR